MVERTGPSLVLAILAFPAYFVQSLLPIIPAIFQFIELDRALAISSLALVPAAAVFLSLRRKFSQAWILAICVVWAIFKLSALSWAPVSPASLSALGWVTENTPISATVLTTPGDGYLAAYVSHRKNTIDGHFVGRNDSEQRYRDNLDAMGNPGFSLSRFSANYLLITSRSIGEVNAAPSWKQRFSVSETPRDSAFVYSAS